ncbi:MAG: hypothetical protein ACXVPR_03360 [Actinomycetota bacterium]
MPVPAERFDAPAAWGAYAAVVVLAFLVTWVVTDRLHVRRTPYIGILSALVLALGAGYLAWSGTSLRELVVDGWGWGVVAGILVGGMLTPLVRRLPPTEPAGTRVSPGRYAWEGLVYGFAEAIILASLPVIVIWQAMADAGWTEGAGRTAATGALAVAGAVLVILVHHLGYAEFRRPSARRELLGTLFGCGLQAVAFAVTGNLIAPVLAHVILHAQLLTRHVQMPPEDGSRFELAYLAGSERVHERVRASGERVPRR